MIDTQAPQRGERQADRGPAEHLVGRWAEVDRTREFLAIARSDGWTRRLTGEPRVGKTEVLAAASQAAVERRHPHQSVRPASSSNQTKVSDPPPPEVARRYGLDAELGGDRKASTGGPAPW